jgi:putative ABC transport system substrate-binding protein
MLSGAFGAAVLDPQLFDGFREGMRDRGWIEGKNVTFVALSDVKNAPNFAAALADLKADLLLTGNATAAQAAQAAMPTMPIVIAGVAEPVSLDPPLAASLARPGANVTGVARLPAQLVPKRLELLKEVLPGVARVAALWEQTSSGAALQIRATEAAAAGLGLQVQTLAVTSIGDFEGAVAAATRAEAQALTLHGPLTFTGRARIVDLALRARLPSMAIDRLYVEAGVLMSYGESNVDCYRGAAKYVDKILRGAKPAELPIEQSSVIEFVVNRKTAQALELMIPPSVTSRVTEWLL